MKITKLGHVVALAGFWIGSIIAGVNGAAVWQAIITGTAFAIAILVITSGATE